jgi:predicted metal-dependent HD superfamily phosphohydrolase
LHDAHRSLFTACREIQPGRRSGQPLVARDLYKIFSAKRHYHTIAHLEHLVENLKEVQNHISDWDTVLFAVFYHDIIYKSTSSTNEADSAKLAKERLGELHYDPEKMAHCEKMVLATKSHGLSGDKDTDFLTDADLSILGQSPDVYQDYRENVREEYAIYPDFLYNSGRKKALLDFIAMKQIYKTDHFFVKYEKQARKNLENELEDLDR